jgi:cytochrome c oxidase subunit 4
MNHPASGHSHAAHGHSDHGHGSSIGVYVAVFLALCVLTSASFFTYSSYWPWRDTPAVGRMFMMAVSATKAMLVIMFFMHLKYEASWKYVLTVPAAIMSVFLVLALIPDIGLRNRWASSERRSFMAEPHAPAAHGEQGEYSAEDGNH